VGVVLDAELVRHGQQHDIGFCDGLSHVARGSAGETRPVERSRSRRGAGFGIAAQLPLQLAILRRGLRAGACHFQARRCAPPVCRNSAAVCRELSAPDRPAPAGFQSPFVPADARCDITTRARGRLWPRVDDPALSRFFGCRTG
jgi:hypothetical protein